MPGYNRWYNKPEEDSPEIRRIVNNAFKKTFTISGNEKYILPQPNSMFIENPWEIEELQKLKRDLNNVKSKLNNYSFAEWHKHTSLRNKAKDVERRVSKEFDPEFVTQAWCKFHEIVSKYPLVPKETIYTNNNLFISLHLCEAPGAFITCLNHWLKTNAPTIRWDWLAMTYNPYYEGNSNKKMISDDRFIMHTLRNWIFGKDNTGNLMALENLDYLIEESKAKGKITLVTADGSVNCISNPGEQESIVVSLHFCEVVAAMHILEAGGNFLLKIFTTFEHESICLIYFLTCAFIKIHFYKPVTSKEGNSEVYVICLQFKGPEFVLPYLDILKKQYGLNSVTAMFKRDDIPESFIQQIISCAQIFKNHQCEVIENNISTYHSNNQLSYSQEKRIPKLVADKFMVDFPLQKLHMDLQIVGNLILKKTKFSHWVIQNPIDSFNERQQKQVLEPVEQLLMYAEQLNSLGSTSKTFTFKRTNLPVDTYLNVGKSYQRIHSSRFCSVQISEIYDLFFQILDMEKSIEFLLPTDESIEKFELKMQKVWDNTYKISHFRYTEIYDNKKTISRIKEILDNLEMENNLVLIGFLSLTQFNVGLIYLLAHTFDNVEFNINEEIGCSITYKGFRKKDIVLKIIDQINETAESVLTNDTTILSVISVTELYGSELYPTVVNVNNWITKYCVNYIHSIYYKQRQLKVQEST